MWYGDKGRADWRNTGSSHDYHSIQGGQEIWTTHADYVNHAGRGYRDFGTPVFIVNLFTV